MTTEPVYAELLEVKPPLWRPLLFAIVGGLVGGFVGAAVALVGLT